MNGPIIDPCGTPLIISRHSLFLLPILTLCFLLQKQLFMRSHASLQMPYAFNLHNNNLYGSESNALDKSVSNAIATSPLSSAF